MRADSANKAAFFACLRDEWAPALRRRGFKGSGQRFVRDLGEVVHAVGVQVNKYGGSCCVNLGVHPRVLPLTAGGVPTSPKEVRPEGAEFRWRLTPPGHTDYWWGFEPGVAAHLPWGMEGGAGSTPEARARHLAETFWSEGEPALQSLATVSALARLIPLEAITGEGAPSARYVYTAQRAALTMARLHAHLGDQTQARAFARAGLDRLGPAKGLRPALEALAAD